MKAPPQYNAATVFERYRRHISKVSPMSYPHFELHNIDILQLYILYPDHFPDEIKELLCNLNDNDLKDILVPNFHINLKSALVIHHDLFKKYNDLYEEFDNKAKRNATLHVSSLKQDYVENFTKLNKAITDDLKYNFIQCILSVEGTAKLREHLDTLLFACLFFYNKHWDVYGTSFNGKVSKQNSVKNLTLAEQPFHYRAHNQAKYISKLLYYYFKSPNKLHEVNIVVGGQPHLTDDPIIINWVVQSLIERIEANKLPLSLDYLGEMLSRTLSKRGEVTEQAFLSHLKAFSEIEAPTYINEKRKVVRAFCLDIHKLFTYYLESSVVEFHKTELMIYNNILSLFQMDDFSNTHRKSQHESSKKTRKDTIENRLRELLRREDHS